MFSSIRSSIVNRLPTASFEPLETRRMMANATDLDLSFHGNGKVITDFGGANDVAHAVAVQADGKIVVAGEAEVTVNGVKKIAFAAVRYNKDGSLDDGSAKDTTTGDKFGTAGKFTRVLDQGGGTGAVAVSIQKDGKIVLGGNAIKSTAAGSQWYFLRLNKDGSPDSGSAARACNRRTMRPDWTRGSRQWGCFPPDRSSSPALSKGRGTSAHSPAVGSSTPTSATAGKAPPTSTATTFPPQ